MMFFPVYDVLDHNLDGEVAPRLPSFHLQIITWNKLKTKAGTVFGRVMTERLAQVFTLHKKVW